MSESQELSMHVIGTERYRSKNEKFHQAKPSPFLELSDTEVESSWTQRNKVSAEHKDIYLHLFSQHMTKPACNDCYTQVLHFCGKIAAESNLNIDYNYKFQVTAGRFEEISSPSNLLFYV